MLAPRMPAGILTLYVSNIGNRFPPFITAQRCAYKPMFGTRACVLHVCVGPVSGLTRSVVEYTFSLAPVLRCFVFDKKKFWFRKRRRREFLFVSPLSPMRARYERPSDRVTGRISYVMSLWIDSRLCSVH